MTFYHPKYMNVNDFISNQISFQHYFSILNKYFRLVELQVELTSDQIKNFSRSAYLGFFERQDRLRKLDISVLVMDMTTSTTATFAQGL